MVLRPLRFLVFALATLVVACGDSDSADASPPDAAPPEASNSATSLAFDTEGTLTLAPGEPTEVRVVVEPPGVHVVRFALLGDSLDASLDTDERVTAQDGSTEVTLTAPASATTFRLRATVGDDSAEVAVSVSGEGFISVRVFPSYQGIRSAPLWTASAIARSKCADLPGKPPEDGPIVGQALDDAPVVLHGIPMGPSIAITLRSAHSISGCTDLTVEHAVESRDVTIKVSDIPVDVSATHLTLTMTMSPDGSVAWPILDSATDTFLDALLPSDRSEATALLDSIEQHVPDDSAFSDARMLGGWDSLLAAWLDESGQLLRDEVRAWIDEGFEPLRTGRTLLGQLEAMKSNDKHAVLSLESFYGLPIEATGMPREHVVSLAIEPGDTMIVGGSVSGFPSALIAAAGDAGVAAKLDTEPNAIAAIKDVVGCDRLAAELETTHPLPGSCGTVCITDACEAGIASIWNRAVASSMPNFDTFNLSFTVSGTASVNGETVVTALNAAWVGALSLGEDAASLRGKATADVEAPHTR